MHTPLCDLLGLEVPILCAPFGPWDQVELALAVGRAGGLGQLGATVRPLPQLREQWGRVAAGGRPWAINHTTRPFDPDVFAASLAARPTAISFHMGDPGDLVERAHAAGCLWIQQVMDSDQAECALDRGADVLVAQGGEAGGHSGAISTLVLVPQVVDLAGDVPVVAAGGIADGRGLAAALALGAQGAVLGTRLLASTEMAVADDWKRRIVAAGARDAIKSPAFDALLPPHNRPHWDVQPRALRNDDPPAWDPPRLIAEVLAGGGHEVLAFAGQSAGLVHDVRPAGEIVAETVEQAEVILGRLVPV
ncbi:MAG TPA: nitronate monooxygenase [Solirubrobacteraceae bacterium]|jgi:nitronate monooxygenase/enoyl-[acyl-carrier protein] reductase II